jgi:hypothetical protein
MSDKIEELKKQAADTEERAAKFERLHAESTIKRELREAAERGGAFNADQLMPYLMPAAKLIEVNGQNMVRIVKTDEKGQEVLFTPAEAVGHLKQTKDLENLFKKPVPVQPTAPTTPPKIDWAHMTHPEYLKLRDEHPEWIGLVPKRRK